MVTGKDLVRAACPYLGQPYSKMDCQGFVEKALADVGISVNLAGSNAWYREIMRNGWVGSPEECVEKYGFIPDGAFLFILKDDGKEPATYQGDGIGNASHIGICTNLTGQQMVDVAAEFGNRIAVNYFFGDGAIHSSSSRGCVCTSKFKGQTINNGGWNRVGLWDKVSYNLGTKSSTPTQPEPEPVKETTAVVWAESGATVNLRKAPYGALVNRVPVGATVKVTETGEDWEKVTYTTDSGAVWRGWMMKKFLKADDGKLHVVHIPKLTIYQAEALLKKYPDGWLDDGVG